MPASRRLFVAIAAPRIPQAAEWRIDEVAGRLEGARRTHAQARHMTLAFLGDVAAEDLPVAAQAARAAAQACAAFAYSFDRIGGFPGRTARILALGGSTPPEMRSLAADLVQRLRAAGLPVDARPVRLHITVARLRAAQDIPQQEIETVLGQAEEIGLYESELLSAGARYTVLERFPLSPELFVDGGL